MSIVTTSVTEISVNNYSHTVERTARGNFAKLTHETSWIIGVGADFAVDLDQTLHHDLGDLVVVQGILETIT